MSESISSTSSMPSLRTVSVQSPKVEQPWTGQESISSEHLHIDFSLSRLPNKYLLDFIYLAYAKLIEMEKDDDYIIQYFGLSAERMASK